MRDEVKPDVVRDPREIARRALTLFAVIGLALGTPRDELIVWLKEEDLWNELTPSELAYVSARSPKEKQTINMTWQSEALLVLLWALGKIEVLPPANEQCDTSLFQDLLPPFAEISTVDFIASVNRRSEDVLLGKAEELLNLHWEARDADINSRPIPPHVDIEIIQERHHAINWVVGYGGLTWDEVTTDT